MIVEGSSLLNVRDDRCSRKDHRVCHCADDEESSEQRHGTSESKDTLGSAVREIRVFHSVFGYGYVIGHYSTKRESVKESPDKKAEDSGQKAIWKPKKLLSLLSDFCLLITVPTPISS